MSLLGLSKFTWYAAISAMLTAAVVQHAWITREQFYPAVIYLVTSKIAVVTLANQAAVIMIGISKAVKAIFLGELRLREQERVHEHLKYTVMELAMALTLFREELSARTLALFGMLFISKFFHVALDERLAAVVQDQANPNTPCMPALAHARLLSLLALLFGMNGLCISVFGSLLAEQGVSVLLLFLFEYCLLELEVLRLAWKYAVLGISRRLATPGPEGTLGEWPDRQMVTLYGQLAVNAVKVCVYMAYFTLLASFYGMPVIMIRDLLKAFHEAGTEAGNLLAVRKLRSQMATIFKSPTAEDLGRHDPMCIVCQSDVTPTPADLASSVRFPCGHIFHRACILSWFHQQQRCPTCRASMDDLLSRAKRDLQEEERRSRGLAAEGGAAAATAAAAPGAAGGVAPATAADAAAAAGPAVPISAADGAAASAATAPSAAAGTVAGGAERGVEPSSSAAEREEKEERRAKRDKARRDKDKERERDREREGDRSERRRARAATGATSAGSPTAPSPLDHAFNLASLGQISGTPLFSALSGGTGAPHSPLSPYPPFSLAAQMASQAQAQGTHTPSSTPAMPPWGAAAAAGMLPSLTLPGNALGPLPPSLGAVTPSATPLLGGGMAPLSPYLGSMSPLAMGVGAGSGSMAAWSGTPASIAATSGQQAHIALAQIATAQQVALLQMQLQQLQLAQQVVSAAALQESAGEAAAAAAGQEFAEGGAAGTDAAASARLFAPLHQGLSSVPALPSSPIRSATASRSTTAPPSPLLSLLPAMPPLPSSAVKQQAAATAAGAAAAREGSDSRQAGVTTPE